MGNNNLSMIVELKKKAKLSSNCIERMKLYYKAAELDDIEAIEETVKLAPFIYNSGWENKCGLNIDKVLEYINRLSDSEDVEIIKEISNFYFYQRNYTKALKYLKKAAEFGDAASMVQIADNYFLGDIIKEDYKEAFYWYMRAAKLGFSIGMKQVGMMYYKGRGVKRNKKQGLKWTLRALITDARKGDLLSMLSIADMYYDGDLIKQNHDKAMRWYKKSIEIHDYAEPMYK